MPLVKDDRNVELERPISDDEVKCVVFQMHPTKAPRPDGMTPGFYQKHWGIVGSDVCRGVREMVFSGQILHKINYTHVTLIPKVKEVTKMSQLRPISLCNVIYKIMAKVLTNRLKSVLPRIISPT